MQKRHSPKWFEANTAWRKRALSQIKDWVIEHDRSSWDKFTEKVVVDHFARLESFISWFFPEAPPAPFAWDDAAALIVLPKSYALRLARALFRGGPGIARDLQAEDIAFNLDWFYPKSFPPPAPRPTPLSGPALEAWVSKHLKKRSPRRKVVRTKRKK